MVAAARDIAASIPDEEAAAFYHTVQLLFTLSGDALQDMYERIGVPPRRRVSADRARVWTMLHWGRPSLRNTLLMVGAAIFARLPPRVIGPAWWTDDPRECARAVTAAVRDFAEAPEELALYYEWLALHHEERRAQRDAAAILRRNPAVDRQLRVSLDTVEADMGVTELKATIAAIHLAADERRTQALAAAPEVVLPIVQHQLSETEAEIRALEERVRRLEGERDRLQRALDDARSQVVEVTGFYEALLRHREARDRGGDEMETPRPLDGLHVVIAGDPGHASGYRALATALGAERVEAFDAIDDPAVQVSQRLVAADLPVLVTAYASHSLQRRVEGFVARDRLVLVDRAGLAAVREALLAAAFARACRQRSRTTPSQKHDSGDE